jgi:hypothetical protein
LKITIDIDDYLNELTGAYRNRLGYFAMDQEQQAQVDKYIKESIQANPASEKEWADDIKTLAVHGAMYEFEKWLRTQKWSEN